MYIESKKSHSTWYCSLFIPSPLSSSTPMKSRSIFQGLLSRQLEVFLFSLQVHLLHHSSNSSKCPLSLFPLMRYWWTHSSCPFLSNILKLHTFDAFSLYTYKMSRILCVFYSAPCILCETNSDLLSFFCSSLLVWCSAAASTGHWNELWLLKEVSDWEQLELWACSLNLQSATGKVSQP